jgi:hypothetical protein
MAACFSSDRKRNGLKLLGVFKAEPCRGVAIKVESSWSRSRFERVVDVLYAAVCLDPQSRFVFEGAPQLSSQRTAFVRYHDAQPRIKSGTEDDTLPQNSLPFVLPFPLERPDGSRVYRRRKAGEDGHSG